MSTTKRPFRPRVGPLPTQPEPTLAPPPTFTSVQPESQSIDIDSKSSRAVDIERDRRKKNPTPQRPHRPQADKTIRRGGRAVGLHTTEEDRVAGKASAKAGGRNAGKTRQASQGEEEIKANAPREQLEASLEHLVMPKKPRNKRKAGPAGFVLVPAVGHVIALEEEPLRTGPDEPFEHISRDELDDPRVEKPSFADVVRGWD